MENKEHFEVEKTCEVCGKTFMARKINARFCSQRCQKRAFYKNRAENMNEEDKVFNEEPTSKASNNMNSSFYGVLGGLFGVGKHGSEQEQMLTSLLAVQKDKIESSQSISLMKYQLEELTKRFDTLKAEYDTIKAAVIDLQKENDKLTKENEELAEENEKLSVESEANGNKVNQIGSIAGVALTQALMGLLPNTKLGQLMGLGGIDEPAPEKEPSMEPEALKPSVSVVPIEKEYEVEEITPPMVKQVG